MRLKTFLPPAATAIVNDRRGLAMIEFAMALPVLLALALTGLETTSYAIATMQVHQIATGVADNVARVRDSISDGDVNEALLSANLIGKGIDFGSRGRVVVSSVSSNGLTGSKAGQWIRWQRCSGALNNSDSQPRYGTEDKGKTDNSLKFMGTAPRQIAASGTNSLIFVEVTYTYKPVVGDAILGSRTIRSEAVYSVRERNDENIQSVAGVTARTCNTYSAT